MNRWGVLALLFLVRTTMAFQFQAVGALSPVFQQVFAVTIADIGLLIGLYFSPGLFLAVPGGTLGQKFGDKRVVLVGLAMMTFGGVLMALSTSWMGQITGRLFAGFGGVLLNVLMTKMVADWFTGKEISFSMAVFVNSWPVGIALALVVLPTIAESSGLAAAQLVVALLTAIAFLGLGFLYRSPITKSESAATSSTQIRYAQFGALIAAGTIWGFYNAALAIVFSFGPELYIKLGMSFVEAGTVTSILLWLLAIGGSLAGLLVDWTGRRTLILVVGNLGFAIFVLVGTWTDKIVLNVFAMGAFSGVAIGAMMSLPALILSSSQRAVGMGIFFTVFYIWTMLGPMLAGHLANITGNVETTFLFAASLLVCSVLVLPIFHVLAAKREKVY